VAAGRFYIWTQNAKRHWKKIGRRNNVVDLLNKRRNERRVGVKMPDDIRATPIKFGEVVGYVTSEYSESHLEVSHNVKQSEFFARQLHRQTRASGRHLAVKHSPAANR